VASFIVLPVPRLNRGATKYRLPSETMPAPKQIT